MGQYAMETATSNVVAMIPTSTGVLDGRSVFVCRQFSEKNQAIAMEMVRGNGGSLAGPHAADYILMPLEEEKEEGQENAGLSERGIPVTMAWLVRAS